MATAIKKTKAPKVAYKIDSKLIDKLYKVRIKLKHSVKYGGNVAGLCLLGEKDGIIDTYVTMISSKGCWDAPSISHSVFETAFMKMIEKDRAVMGMALIRPGTYDASLPADFRANIRNWKHAFKDITNTVWIVVSDNNIIPYGVTKDAVDKIQFHEYRGKVFVSPGDSKMLKIADMRHKMRNLAPNETLQMRTHLDHLAQTIIKDTSGVQILKNIKIEHEVIESKRKERLKKLQQQRDASKKRKEHAEKLYKDQQTRKLTKKKQEKDGMKDTVDLGDGYFLIKGKNGEELLWKK